MPHPIVRSVAADGPMLPTVDGLPDRAGWVFEPNWDGWRYLAMVDDGGRKAEPLRRSAQGATTGIERSLASRR